VIVLFWQSKPVWHDARGDKSENGMQRLVNKALLTPKRIVYLSTVTFNP
jgi:hypothetical protein